MPPNTPSRSLRLMANYSKMYELISMPYILLTVGNTANYCIVIAQLYIKGECYGIHSFIVQVRDEDTHMPLPGIKVGEIGVKMGLNSVNNGFLGFDKVRIPRTHMLMKHAKVLKVRTLRLKVRLLTDSLSTLIITKLGL